MPPPDWAAILHGEGRDRIFSAMVGADLDDSAYLPWDKVRYRTPPAGLTAQEFWAALKLRRQSGLRTVSLLSKDGKAFSYTLTDHLLRRCEEIAARASGTISMPELAVSQGDRDRYVVSSLIEEAITSSQLEGASTSRRVAKEMLVSGRRPVTRSERMILNNYRAMERIREVTEERLTPELVLELHRIVTDGTLDDPEDAGRLQQESDERVRIFGDDDQILHVPPPAAELADRLQALCRFANGEDGDTAYLPAPLRSIVLHFMVGYDHYFADGNGRTARILFYWSMLRQGYWVTEYLTVSRILKNAPARYPGAYLLTEDDDGDLTYFLTFHVDVCTRALDDLQRHLQRKSAELRDMRALLDRRSNDFNPRQLAALESALRDPQSEFTVHGHATTHRISGETARVDLLGLEEAGLFVRSRRSKSYVWRPAGDAGRVVEIAADE
ncbi:Fic family protein [Rathayibacter sp. PhB127]|uniref:Fic family protein n=1 Tax=Rathayibacter sp. PhB127 TaxID=2485176 RepID=UPI0021A7F14C|nr:Fic family protein [Rathayibacter sp. PhB127]